MFLKFLYTLFFFFFNFKRKIIAKKNIQWYKKQQGIFKCLEADSPVSLWSSTKASVVVYLFWISALQRSCPCFLETCCPDCSLHTAEPAMISTVRRSQIFQYLHWEAKNEQTKIKFQFQKKCIFTGNSEEC